MLKVFFDSNNLYAATLGGLSIAPVNDNNIGSFSNKTQTDNGLGSDSVGGVFAKDNLVYAATFNTNGGMSKSTDGGEHFTHIEFEPAGSNAVFVGNSNQNVYAAAPSTGLEFSGDGGNSYQLLTTANGLGSDEANDVYVQAGQVYVATGAGVSIAPATSTNIPTFTNYPVGVNFSSNGVNGVFALNQAIYAATNHGIFVTYLP